MIIKPLLIVFLIPLVVIKDLIPLIDSQYRTIPKRNDRAIAGLSMGGGTNGCFGEDI